MYIKVLKFNPNHGPDGKFSEAATGGASESGRPSKANNSATTKPKSAKPLTVKPTFSPRAKLTIQSASEALGKQGIKLDHAGMENFSPRYKLTDKNGSTQVVSAKELTKLLTKKTDQFNEDVKQILGMRGVVGMYAHIFKGAPLGNCNAIGGKVGECGAGRGATEPASSLASDMGRPKIPASSVSVGGEDAYKYANGKKPSGKGTWLFSTGKSIDFSKNPKAGEDYYQSPYGTSYSDAKKQAKAWAGAKGKRSVNVMS